MATKIVYTGGTFDLLHPGHMNFLKKARELGDFLVVSLNTDEFCAQYKRKPIMTYKERKEALKACRYVDAVVENSGGFDSKPAIDAVRPQIIVHGDDWTGPKYLKQLGITSGYLKKRGIKLVYVPYTKGISTTNLIKRIYENQRTHTNN